MFLEFTILTSFTFLLSAVSVIVSGLSILLNTSTPKISILIPSTYPSLVDTSNL